MVRGDGAAIWRSANATLLRPIKEGGGLLTSSLLTSFLVISGTALLEGRSYVISVSATGSRVAAQVRKWRVLGSKYLSHIRYMNESAALNPNYAYCGVTYMSQVTLFVNEGPRGGSLVISPLTGQALLTTFTAM